MSSVTLKECKDCHRMLPETREYFGQFKNKRNGAVRIGYRNQCRECMAANTKRHSQNNPQQVLARGQRRRARETSQASEISQERCERLLVILEGKCRYCEEPLSDGHEEDHLTPLARGGTNKDGNITIACLQCNRAKGSKTLTEFEDWRRERGLHVRCVRVTDEKPDKARSNVLRRQYP
jgi:5-methylcytosine-specific restriction endonuclease McrA